MTADRSTAQIAWRGSAQVRRFQEEMARRRTEEARRIGTNIAALRERHHLTQEAAAAKLKIAYRTYQSWEQGTSVPRWATRERIAKFYGVPIEEVNGPPVPGDGEQLDRIEQQVSDLHALFFGVGEGEGAIAARLLQAGESPPPPAGDEPESPPEAQTPPSA